MMKRIKNLGVSVAGATLLLGGPAAHSTVIITIADSASNVVVNASGTLDMDGAVPLGQSLTYNPAGSSGVIPGGSNWYVALGADTTDNIYSLTGVDVPFGTSGFYTQGASTSGNTIGIWAHDGGVIILPPGYVSGSAISSTMSLLGTSIAALTLTPGSYIFSLPHDEVILNIGATPAVPEPGAWAMMILGLATVGWTLRRRPALRLA
jgi:hypothetical protein